MMYDVWCMRKMDGCKKTHGQEKKEEQEEEATLKRKETPLFFVIA